MRLPARPLVLAVLSLATATAFGCVGKDPVLSGPDEPDSGAADAGTTAGSVVSRGDFETAGCLGWTTNEATATSDPDKHGGSFACRVCATGSTSVWGIFQDLSSAAPGGYVARGFLRASGSEGPSTVFIRLEAFANGAQIGVDREGQATMAPGEPWAETQAELAVEAGQTLAVAILSQTPGGCFLVDDVTVVRR